MMKYLFFFGGGGFRDKTKSDHVSYHQNESRKNSDGKKNHRKKRNRAMLALFLHLSLIDFFFLIPNPEHSMNSGNLGSQCCCGSTILGFSE